MKKATNMKIHMLRSLLLGALALNAGSAAAVDYHLVAKPYLKTMPDGPPIPMWGYVLDDADGILPTDGACYNTTTSIVDRQTCANALPDPTSPGPRIVANPGSGPGGHNNLRIFLTNMLPEPTSLVISGRELPWSSNSPDNGPTFVNPFGTGSRTSPSQRVRSFGLEAEPNGGRQRYIWNNFRDTPFDRSGTFVYHSGTYPQKQVYMGLYGAATKDVAAGEAYDGVTYDQEVVLFYSEIDPVINAAIDAGTHTTSIAYHARWFLVNGEPYVGGATPTADIDAGAAGTNTLLRMLSTAGETHVPTLQGLRMVLHAEDGWQYNYQIGASPGGAAPRSQYSAMLPPLKTKDAIVSATAAGRYAVYDGNGYMTNPSDPANTAVGDEIGGMLRFLSFDPPPPRDQTTPVGGKGDGPIGIQLPIGGAQTGGNDGGGRIRD